MALAIPHAIERLLATPTISARFPARNPISMYLERRTAAASPQPARSGC
jgi:hypothetical protein